MMVREVVRLTGVATIASVIALGAAGCGKKQKPAQGGAEGTAAPAGGTSASAAPTPAPPGIPIAIDKLSRETPEKAAASLRKLGETSVDAADFGAWFDPSQSALAVKFVGPSLMYYGRMAMLRRAAEERFGPTGADEVVAGATFLQIDLENGLEELFRAERVQDVRRAGPNAYVMAIDASGEMMGDAICFRENQGEWLLLISAGDTPWPESKMANLAGVLGGPMQNMPRVVGALADIARRIREGEFKTAAEAAAVAQAQVRGG